MREILDRPISISQLDEVFKSIVDHAGARLVYGEPITLEGKTVLPVAKIRYGFGSGSGRNGDDRRGGGGGGGLIARPLGVIEITASQTRFIPIAPGRMLAAAALIGLLLGRLTARRRPARGHA
jgi:uncharacterized spore protein YtfJ